jgi:hypothetical protein
LSSLLVDGSNVSTPSDVSSFGGGVVSFILHLVIFALLFVVLSSPFGVEGFYLPGISSKRWHVHQSSIEHVT